MAAIKSAERINIEAPRYDQSTYGGRAKHFFITTNPLNVFATGSQLERARQLVQQYRSGQEPLGLTENELWRAKNLYDSAFHPDTGEKMFILGRMSAQVPMNMFITGCMMTFYKSTPAVVFWQWFNQSFNAVVNYTNRSGDSPISTQRLGVSYVAATAGAMGTALGLNRLVKSMPPLIGRYVPFAAVAAANCVNIPCMRSRELTHGIPVFTEDGERVGQSTKAAKKAITQVVISRVIMASPGMMLPPLIMARLEKGAFLKKFPYMTAPVQIGIVGALSYGNKIWGVLAKCLADDKGGLIFATPMCCALFPQRSSIAVSSLESELQEKLKDRNITRVYYNKGL